MPYKAIQKTMAKNIKEYVAQEVIKHLTKPIEKQLRRQIADELDVFFCEDCDEFFFVRGNTEPSGYVDGKIQDNFVDCCENCLNSNRCVCNDCYYLWKQCEQICNQPRLCMDCDVDAYVSASRGEHSPKVTSCGKQCNGRICPRCKQCDYEDHNKPPLSILQN